MVFRDRREAGQKLAAALKKYKNRPETVILALPRGGVVCGAQAAAELHLPLDIVVPRKIGAPENPEYAVGALTETGEIIWNEEEIKSIAPEALKETIALEKKEAARRLKIYRGGRAPLDLGGKTVILVDDGVATGLTMRAAISAVKQRKPLKIVVAVPVSAEDAAEKIKAEVDEFIALQTPAFFVAIGAFYETFNQTTDKEVVELLRNKNL